MSTHPQQHTVTVPEQGNPSDWHLFPTGARKPAAGDIALCGHILTGNVGHRDADPSSTGSDGVPWCPLCVHLAAMLKDLRR